MFIDRATILNSCTGIHITSTIITTMHIIYIYMFIYIYISIFSSANWVKERKHLRRKGRSSLSVNQDDPESVCGIDKACQFSDWERDKMPWNCNSKNQLPRKYVRRHTKMGRETHNFLLGLPLEMSSIILGRPWLRYALDWGETLTEAAIWLKQDLRLKQAFWLKEGEPLTAAAKRRHDIVNNQPNSTHNINLPLQHPSLALTPLIRTPTHNTQAHHLYFCSPRDKL